MNELDCVFLGLILGAPTALLLWALGFLLVAIVDASLAIMRKEYDVAVWWVAWGFPATYFVTFFGWTHIFLMHMQGKI